VLKAVKVRIYPTAAQQAHLAQAFGCVRWVWNQSLATMTATDRETGKGVTAMTMKKSIPLWKAEFEWLSECYSQCLQQSVLNLGVAFGNFFDGLCMYPTFKKRQGKQSIQSPQNVKVLSDCQIKFPGKLGVVEARVHRDIEGKVKTVTLVHSKIKRVREDFLHKLSRKIVDENQVIVVENLAVRNMVKNHCLAKAISDAGWSRFCTMLKYKAEMVGKVYLEIGRFFASTHLCSHTLKPLPKMDLSVREFDCPHCNQRHDRDINAAINIKNAGK
jgi:IS605 OrfB family transposase